MFDVLKRGGVIGGTSAGATIQGDYLCRGGVQQLRYRLPRLRTRPGFLKGVADPISISAERKRLREMSQLVKTYPPYLGIGLDEASSS